MDSAANLASRGSAHNSPGKIGRSGRVLGRAGGCRGAGRVRACVPCDVHAHAHAHAHLYMYVALRRLSAFTPPGLLATRFGRQLADRSRAGLLEEVLVPLMECTRALTLEAARAVACTSLLCPACVRSESRAKSELVVRAVATCRFIDSFLLAAGHVRRLSTCVPECVSLLKALFCPAAAAIHPQHHLISAGPRVISGRSSCDICRSPCEPPAPAPPTPPTHMPSMLQQPPLQQGGLQG